MAQAFLVVLDEGMYAERNWDVVEVCSSRQIAEGKLTALVKEDFLSGEKGVHYWSPYHIQTWDMDGERVDDPTSYTSITLAQLCKASPEVKEALAARRKRDEENKKLMDQHLAEQNRLATRQALEQKTIKTKWKLRQS